MAAEPRRRSAGPSVAETVTEAHITPGAAVGMDIELSFGHHLVDARRVFRVFIVEIFPEGRRPQVQHPAPVGGNEVHGLGIMAAGGKGLQQVIAHEGSELFRSVPQDDLRGLLRIHQAFQGEQGRGLAVADGIGDIGPQAPGSRQAFLLQSLVFQPFRHFRSGFQRAYAQGLQAGMDDRRLVIGRPVDEPAVPVGLP